VPPDGSCHDSVGPFFKIPHVGDRPALGMLVGHPHLFPKTGAFA